MKAFIKISLINILMATICNAEDKIKEAAKSAKMVKIEPVIPMGGVSQLTKEQNQTNLNHLAQVNQALKDFDAMPGELTAADHTQQALMKERQAYLACMANSYSYVKKLEARVKGLEAEISLMKAKNK